jgi:hypothetical protein
MVAGFRYPVVFDPEETDQNLPRMVSYNFFAEVLPGPHHVEVLYAGCCSRESGRAIWCGAVARADPRTGRARQ